MANTAPLFLDTGAMPDVGEKFIGRIHDACLLEEHRRMMYGGMMAAIRMEISQESAARYCGFISSLIQTSLDLTKFLHQSKDMDWADFKILLQGSLVKQIEHVGRKQQTLEIFKCNLRLEAPSAYELIESFPSLTNGLNELLPLLPPKEPEVSPAQLHEDYAGKLDRILGL